MSHRSVSRRLSLDLIQASGASLLVHQTMTLQFSLTSTSSGDVFESTYKALNTQGTVPTVLLPPSHPFHQLWRDHLAALTRPGLFDPVIDALIALAHGSPAWRKKASSKAIVTKRSEIRDLLRQHPPNIVLVRGVRGVYAYHLRRPSLWGFICISEEYVQLWQEAEQSSEGRLGLTALLRTTIDHELGHWIFSLKVGQLSAEHLEENDARCKPEMMEPTWESDTEEAGKFVEVQSRGGLLYYSKGVQKAILLTGGGMADRHTLPLSYLQVYLQESPIANPSLRFSPPPPPGSSRQVTKNVQGDIFFPRTTDDCVRQPSVYVEPPGVCGRRVSTSLFIRKLLRERGSKSGGGA